MGVVRLVVPDELISHRVRHASQVNSAYLRRNSLKSWWEKVSINLASRLAASAANMEILAIYHFPRSLSAPVMFSDLQNPDTVFAHSIDISPLAEQCRTNSLRS